MKTLFQIVVAGVSLIGFSPRLAATIIYQNDFSGTQTPLSFATTVGDPMFGQSWTVIPSLQPDSGNPYARYDFRIPPPLPTQPGTRWYGGFDAMTGTGTALPAEWQLSFDLFLNVVEPIQVGIVFDYRFPPNQPPFGSVPGNPIFPPRPTGQIFWLQPPAVGWQHMVIDQSTPFLTGPLVFLPDQGGTFLTIGLASQDPSGNPLVISRAGAYNFSLDNILLQSVPEPGTSSLCILVGGMLMVARSYRKGIGPLQ